MSLKDTIKEAMTAAMKNKDSERTQYVRNIWSAIRKKEVDERKDLSDVEIQKVVMNLTKQLQETLDQAKANNRDDLAGEASKEIAVLKEFLPEMLSSDELGKIVGKVVEDLKAAGALPAGNAGMGAIMKKTMEAVGSKADGKSVQEAVRKALQP